MILRGNVLRAGYDTKKLALFMIGGSGDIDLTDDNLASTWSAEDHSDVGSYTTAPEGNRLRNARRCRRTCAVGEAVE